MSLNTSSTPDGKGVLIYNGELILLFSRHVTMSFSDNPHKLFKGSKSGSLYLTSHRMIFVSDKAGEFKSMALPFHSLRDVKLEQPLLKANYLKGAACAQPGGNFDGDVTWRLSFSKGGCVDFGQALLQAADLAQRYRPTDAPPVYAPPPTSFYSAPPQYYIPQNTPMITPSHAFPEHPPAESVYMYETPPPYTGISGATAPYPAGGLQYAGELPNKN